MPLTVEFLSKIAKMQGGGFFLALELKQLRNTLIVRVKGDLDMVLADEMREEIDQRLENINTIRTLIINLDKVTFIDSSGLGVIIGRYKKISSLSGRMYIVGAKPQIYKILAFSGINKVIPMYNNEQDIVNI